MNIQIKCPKCQRLFQVGTEMKGKTVECGGCDTQFPVSESSIVSQRKRESDRFYPGENKSNFLDRIARSQVREAQPVEFQTAAYAPNAKPESYLPPSGAQKMSVAGGIALLILALFFFFFASGKGGALQDVDLLRRIILGSFVSLIGGGLIISGAKNWRIRGILFALALIGGIFALIFIQPVHLTPSGDDRGDDFEISTPDPDTAQPPKNEEETLKKRVGLDQIERVIKESGNPESVIGIYCRPFQESYQQVLTNYFRRKLNLTKLQIPDLYYRESGRGLLLIYNQLDLSLDTIIEHAEALGGVTSHPSLRLIEIQLDSSHFAEPTEELYQRISDPEHPQFSEANLAELRHIDITRSQSAVKRIDNIPASIQLSYRPEMIKELLRLMAENRDFELREDIGSALKRWAGSDPAVAEKVGELIVSESDPDMPTSIIEYLLNAKASQVPFIIDILWAKNPLRWSEQYEALGSAVEDRLIFHLKNSPIKLQKSAVEILRKTGTSKSLSALRAAQATKDPDFKINLRRTIDVIESR